MRNQKQILLAALAAFSITAWAGAEVRALGSSYVEGSVFHSDLDYLDSTGLGATINVPVADYTDIRVALRGESADGPYGIDGSAWDGTFGVVLHNEIRDSGVRPYLMLQAGYAWAEVQGFSDNVFIYGAQVGFEIPLGQDWLFEPAASYIDGTEGDGVWQVGTRLLYGFTDTFAVGASVAYVSEEWVEGWTGGVHFRFAL